MKVMHVLNSRIYSGAEKVASQIIKDFEEEMTLAYCSPESDMVAKMLSEQDIRYIPVSSLLPWKLKKVLKLRLRLRVRKKKHNKRAFRNCEML